jgi:hypothetical protein
MKSSQQDLVLMKRKTSALTLALALLFSAVAGAQLSLSVRAQPSPYTRPTIPIITIESPTNRTYHINSLPLNVTIGTRNNYDEITEGMTTVIMVTYKLDEQPSRPIGNKTSVGYWYGINPIHAGYVLGEYTNFSTSTVLSELTEGLHTLTARVQYDGTFSSGSDLNTHFVSELTVLFRIDFVPQNVSILMPKNSTYEPTGVPLQFFIDEPASWTGYSLDGQETVTVAGNTTLPELSVGQHTLTLYANDAAGNPTASETIRFKIEPFPTTLIIAIVIIITVAGAGLILYFKKRKR